jgi:hypothetical protein
MEVDDKKKSMFVKAPYELKKIQQEAVWNGVLHPESEWGFVKPFGAKLVMRECFKDYGRFKGQAKKLKEYLNSKPIDSYLKICDIILGKVSIEPKNFNGISFCIPTNGKRVEKTKLLLESIRAQNKDMPFEIIICGDIEAFKNEKDVILIDKKQESHSRKVALLRNKAAEKAKFDVIAWCDDDVLLSKKWLQDTIEYSNKRGWNVLGNRVLSPDGTRYWDRATLSPHCLVSYEHDELDPNLYQSSAFFLVRKEVWNKVKWNEDRLIYADQKEPGEIPEDVQYSLDLIENKYTFSFNKNALVWHNDEDYIEINRNNAYFVNICTKKELLEKDQEVKFFPPKCKLFKEDIGLI